MHFIIIQNDWVIHKNAYAVRDIAISDDKIILQYGIALSITTTTKAATPRDLLVLHD